MPTAGPLGRQLIANVRDLLDVRGLSFRRASAALDEIGRPIPPLGLSRALTGERRVDVDELAALAILLGVNPSALLFPRHGGRDDIVPLTDKIEQRAYAVWGWADGRFPLPPEVAPPGLNYVSAPGDRMADYLKHGRPGFAAPADDPAVAELTALTRMVETVLSAPDDPQVWGTWGDMIRRRFRLVAIQLEELAARFDTLGGRLDAAEAKATPGIATLREATARDYQAGAARTVDPLDPFGTRPR